MSYSVAGLIREYEPVGWPRDHAICPHGISVVVNAPAAFRFTSAAAPERHLEAARSLGAEVEGIGTESAGRVLADRLIELMRAAGIPNGLSDLGYAESDIPALAEGADAQQRLLAISPRPVSKGDLADLYADALRYW